MSAPTAPLLVPLLKKILLTLLFVWISWALVLAFLSCRATHVVEPTLRPYVEVHPHLSADGKMLAFEFCRDTVPEKIFDRQRSTRCTDIALVEVATGKVQVVSRGPGGVAANAPSRSPRLDRNGQNLVFASEASNLVADDRDGVANIFLYHQGSSELRRLPPPQSLPGLGSSFDPSISQDGNWVAFTTYGVVDHPLQRGRAPVLYDLKRDVCGEFPMRWGPAYGTVEFDPSGKRIAFSSFASDYFPDHSNVVAGVYLYQRSDASQLFTSTEEGPLRLGPPTDCGYTPALSDSGWALASQTSHGQNGAGSRYDIWVGRFSPPNSPVAPPWRVAGSQEPDDSSFDPVLSGDGRYLAFTSYATNLVSTAGKGCSQVYLCDLETHVIEEISRGPHGEGNGSSYNPTISQDGERIAFVSLADNLEEKPRAPGQIYLWERQTRSLAPLKASLPSGPSLP